MRIQVFLYFILESNAEPSGPWLGQVRNFDGTGKKLREWTFREKYFLFKYHGPPKRIGAHLSLGYLSSYLSRS